MLEFLLAAAADALGGLAGNGAFALYERHQQNEGSSPTTQHLSGRVEDLRGRLRLSMTAAGLRDDEVVGLSTFLGEAEGRLIARYVAYDVIARRDSDMTPILIAQATALIHLAPATRSLDAAHVAPALIASLRIAIGAMYADLSTKDREARLRLIEIANRERQANPNLRLDEAQRELWDLSQYDPATLLAHLRTYAKGVSDRYNLIAIPSLYEERRLPVGEVFVEPVVNHDALPPLGRDFDRATVLSRCLGVAPRLVVLGEPGGGKSTLLGTTVRHLALAFLRDEATGLPIVVSLARYWRDRQGDSSLNILSFIARAVSADYHIDIDVSALRYLLATGRTVLFLDGLDEILSVPQRARVRDEIEGLVRRYRGSSFVVASREVGYLEAPLAQSDFDSVHIGPFDVPRIHRFALQFFRAHPVDEAPDTLANRFMVDTERISTVRANPLMLGLLCILYESGRTIPDNRSELYRNCAEMLFSRWDARRGIEYVVRDADTAEDAVGSIAAEIFESGADEVAESWLRESLSRFYLRERSDSARAADAFASTVLDLWRGRKWLLVEAGHRGGEAHFRFSHRTFLEYFAAQQVSYTSASVDELWPKLRKYVVARSATVYCQLVADLFSRKTRGVGDELVQRLYREAEASSGRLRWNIVTFLSEMLPGVRALVETKGEACGLIAEAIVELVPLSNSYPHYLTFDVYESVFSRTSGEVEIDWDNFTEEGPDAFDGSRG